MKEFEETVYKLQRFIKAAALEVRVKPGELKLIELVVCADPLLYAVHLRDFFSNHADEIQRKDVAAEVKKAKAIIRKNCPEWKG